MPTNYYPDLYNDWSYNLIFLIRELVNEGIYAKIQVHKYTWILTMGSNPKQRYINTAICSDC